MSSTRLAYLNSSFYQGRTEISGEESDSDAEADAEGASATGSNEAGAYGTSPTAPLHAPRPVPMLKLPPNWRRLLDVYFSYTNCWLPLLDKESLTESAQAYPYDGIPAPGGDIDAPSHYAELWAALALAAFQDAASYGSSEGYQSAKTMYAVARSMIPSEERQFEVAHLRSLLLHSLVLIGQGADLAAWMLVGTSTRLALHLRETGNLYRDGFRQDASTNRSGILAFGVCLVLNTFASACLGQPTFLHVDFAEVLGNVEAIRDESESESWKPVDGFGNAFRKLPEEAPINPIRTFHQLLSFCRILSSHIDISHEGSIPNPALAAEKLARSLDHDFAFCNSVILGGSAPEVPSAFVLQISFLSTTIRLLQSYRASLISSLCEVVESCVAAFGACGTPPVVVGLLRIVQRCGHIDRMHEAEQARWRSTLTTLRQVWKQDTLDQTPSASGYTAPSSTGATYQHQRQQQQGGIGSTGDLNTPYSSESVQGGFAPPMQRGYFGDQLGTPGHHARSLSESEYAPQHGQQTGSMDSRGFSMATGSKGSADNRTVPLASPSMDFPPSGDGRASAAPTMFRPGGEYAQQQPVDYDAILEELGSIDCADGLDMDTQFMTNLGFAPGCDLGEMFQQSGDFGV